MDSERVYDKKSAKKRTVPIGMIAIFFLPFILIALFITITYFRKTTTSGPIRDAAVVSPPATPILSAADAVKSNNPNSDAKNNGAANKQTAQKPEPANQILHGQNESVTEVVIKFTTNDTCKLRIRNRSLGEVINWNLSPDDKGTLYLKPGKYSIVATNAISGAKTQKYYFDVKPGDARGTQYLHFRF